MEAWLTVGPIRGQLALLPVALGAQLRVTQIQAWAVLMADLCAFRQSCSRLWNEAGAGVVLSRCPACPFAAGGPPGVQAPAGPGTEVAV